MSSVLDTILSINDYTCFFDHIDFLQGYVFVDRDGKHFRHILNWLRDGEVPTLKDAEYSELLREAEYYQLLVSHSLLKFEVYVWFHICSIVWCSFCLVDVDISSSLSYCIRSFGVME